MCIAIYAPKGKIISKEHFFTSFENNSDGIGIMYADKNGLNIFKWLTEIDTAYKFYQSIQGKTNIAVHFRIGTSGNKDLTNCHPFLSKEGYGIMHNGILDILVPIKSEINDTQIFIRDIINNLPEKWAYNTAIIYLIEKAIAGNKMIIMNRKGEVLVLNEKEGKWKNGIWYSNDTYQKSLPLWNYPKGKIYPHEHNRYLQINSNLSDDFCEECGIDLISQTEKETGYCTDCFHSALSVY